MFSIFKCFLKGFHQFELLHLGFQEGKVGQLLKLAIQFLAQRVELIFGGQKARVTGVDRLSILREEKTFVMLQISRINPLFSNSYYIIDEYWISLFSNVYPLTQNVD